MKRKFISAVLFGALLFAPAGMVVSCSDYDDDIAGLQDQITTNATDLDALVEEKMKNVEIEISSLKSQSEALEAAYKAADENLKKAIETATNDAKGYADIQAAEAQKVAVAQAQALVDNAVAKLEASLAAANEKIGNLVAQDAELQQGIIAAQQRADAAYALAEQVKAMAGENAADIAKVIEDLQSIKTTLEAQISTLDEKLTTLIADAEKQATQVEANRVAIEELKKALETEKNALSDADGELQKLIDANATKIANLETSVAALEELVATNLGLAQKYAEEKANAAYANALIEAGKLDAKLKGEIETALSEIEGKISTLSGEITTLSGKVENILTGKADASALNQLQQDFNSLKGDIEGENGIDARLAALEALLGQTEEPGKDNTVLQDINDLKAKYEALTNDDKSGTLDVLSANLATAETNIGLIEEKLLVINTKLANLEKSLQNLITGIIIQDYEDFYHVYGQTVASFQSADNSVYNEGTRVYDQVFPYRSFAGKQTLRGSKYNYQAFAGEIYTTINPNTINFVGEKLALENSLEEAPAGQYVLGAAEKGEKLLKHRSAEAPTNGFYKIPVTCGLGVNYDSYIAKEDKYAVVASYDSYSTAGKEPRAGVKTETTTHKVYSEYKLLLQATLATRAEAVLGFESSNGTAAIDHQFSGLEGNILLQTSNNNRVYKKFVECIAINDSKGNPLDAKKVAAFNSANSGKLSTILDANNYGEQDVVNVVCPEEFKNNVVTLKYYIWNYNGTVSSVTKKVVFTKPIWALQTATLTNKLSSDQYQTLDVKEFKDWNFTLGKKPTDVNSPVTTWSKEAVSYTLTCKGTKNNQTVTPGVGNTYLTFHKTSAPTKQFTLGLTDTPVAISTKLNTGDVMELLDQVNELKVTYVPSSILLDTDYKYVANFYDQNGYVVNTFEITLRVTYDESMKPINFRLESAFYNPAPNSDVTIGWAVWGGNNNTTYDFINSFNHPESGYTDKYGFTHDYVFVDRDAASYVRPELSNYKPAYYPNPGSNTKIGFSTLQPIKNEHVYNMTAGLDLFDFGQKYYSQDQVGGWKDNFRLVVLSPIRYAILGNEKTVVDEFKLNGTIDPVEVRLPKVPYGGQLTLDNTHFIAYNPADHSGNTIEQVKLFGTDRHAYITDVNIEMANPNDPNRGQVTYTKDDANKTYKFDVRSGASSVDAKIVFNMTVTDVWGIETTTQFKLVIGPSH